MTGSLGDAAQARVIAEQVADATLIRLAERIDQKIHESLAAEKEPPIHPLVKWVVGTVAALGLAALIGGGSWLVSSVSEMQLTLARMDERMTTGAVKDSRVDEIERRVTKLETYHTGGKL